MRMIINNSSETPIYEQIASQIREQISSGDLVAGSMLPSVRSLAGDLKISALTVKKAYDYMEQQGFIVTVHGKGSFVSQLGSNMMVEQLRTEIESDIITLIKKSRNAGIPDGDLLELFHLFIDEKD